ncbi:hypothetical protein QZH41_018754 [Actinostola sp. cb2023]|nr:hypothetical protein QZH41_018754 [Actinostola sp. cb2023]
MKRRFWKPTLRGFQWKMTIYGHSPNILYFYPNYYFCCKFVILVEQGAPLLKLNRLEQWKFPIINGHITIWRVCYQGVYNVLSHGPWLYFSKYILLPSKTKVGCYYLQTKLFPTILLFWKRYQEKMLEKVKALGSSLTVAGDGRHDSMGHCAKYGAYSIFCCTLPMILYFALIQRNQAGSSPAMEYMGFQQSMEFLLGSGLCVSTFISDRHTTIACHMRKVYTNITHYFDLWHIKKKIRKVLSKISKESGCQILSDWIKPCENHFYWSATSTFSGNGSIIWAKFKSFLSHIINKHSNLDDPLFDKCHHGDIPDRKWLQSDSIVYERVNKALTQHSLVNGIKQASPYSQTSSLEGFHSVLNHFSPKMIVYSYAGQYCRHILASVHFNFNLQREIITRNDGSERVKVVWPKYKNGEATVRNVRIKPNFDYIEEIYQTFLEAKKEGQLKDAMQELTAMTPAPMNTMLEEKQTKADALEKRTARRSMTVKDVPPTAPGTCIIIILECNLEKCEIVLTLNSTK